MTEQMFQEQIEAMARRLGWQADYGCCVSKAEGERRRKKAMEDALKAGDWTAATYFSPAPTGGGSWAHDGALRSPDLLCEEGAPASIIFSAAAVLGAARRLRKVALAGS